MALEQKLLKKDYICPYCFEKHLLNNVKFRCENERCIREKDDVYSESSGKGNVLLGRVLVAPEPESALERLRKVMPTECECETCKEVSRMRICPTCHSSLPLTIGEYDDLIFAIIGAKETGKSHFISVLVEKIKKEIGEAYDCHLHPSNDQTIHRYREDFWTPIFKHKEAIHATRSAKSNKENSMPLLYTLQFSRKGLLQKRKIHKVITLSFFDTAGEDLDDQDTMQIVNKYIYNSAGIILLLDPLQLDNVREHEQMKGIRLPNVNSDSGEILYRVTNLIRKAKQLKPKDKINIPIAMTFSKIDAISPILDPASPLNIGYESKHTEQKAFDLVDFENVQLEIEGLMKDWSNSDVKRTLETNFKHYGFFGISSLGINPESDMKITNLKPYRVEDPFLWLLHKHKIIKRKK